MAFNGKWFLTASEGIDPFINACGANRAKLEPLLAGLQMTGSNGYVEEMTVQGDKINRKVFIGGQMKKDRTAPIGVEYDGESWDGQAVKVMVTVDGNSLKRKEKAGSKEINTIVEASGDQATMTMSCEGVSYVRKYQRC